MNNIIIVEDRLGRGISLAEQFMELSESHPEWEIDVLAICYFQASKKKSDEEIEACGQQQFTIRRISLWDFDDVMDEYTDPEGANAIAVIDFMLDGDGSGGFPMRRVNIRYARRTDENRKRRLWFYTGTGIENKKILCQLVGREQVLDVDDVGDSFLRLNLEKEELTEALQGNVLALV